MSRASAIYDALAVGVAGILGFLFFRWAFTAPDWTVIIVVLSVACVILAVIVAAIVAVTIREYRTDRQDDPESHLAPLRRPTPAEAVLTTDLRQRRMLLRPRGLSERAAVILATRTARAAGHRVRQFTVAPEPVRKARRPALAPRPAPRHAAPVGTAAPSPAAVPVLTAKELGQALDAAGGLPRYAALTTFPAMEAALHEFAPPSEWPDWQPIEPEPDLELLPAPVADEDMAAEHNRPHYFPGDEADPEPLYPDDTNWRGFAAIGKGVRA